MEPLFSEIAPAKESLTDLQSVPLRHKVRLTEGRIHDAVYTYGLDKLYVSFSGVDSAVLLSIARRLYPTMKAVFFDTGLEDPTVRQFIRSTENVTIIKPKMPYKKVLEQYGAPVISKSISMAITRYRNARDIFDKPINEFTDIALREKKRVQMGLRLHGGTNPTSGRDQVVGVIPKKWHDLTINGDFKISDKCCDVLKKNPSKDYYKKYGGVPLIGTMADDSNHRRMDYIKHGCNAFDKKYPQSRPLSLWTKKEIWIYIKTNKIKYPKIYDTDNCRSTGCDICLMGIERDPERFLRLKESRPHRYNYCMKVLGYGKILKALGVPSGLEEEEREGEIAPLRSTPLKAVKGGDINEENAPEAKEKTSTQEKEVSLNPSLSSFPHPVTTLTRKRFITSTDNGIHIADYRKPTKPVDLRFMVVSFLVVVVYMAAFWEYVHVFPFVK